MDQLIQEYDTSGQGIETDHIKHLFVLGYADDAAMCEGTVNVVSQSLTEFTDTVFNETDM